MREMLEGGTAARRPHRGLPGRADHADPRSGPAQGPLAGLRPHVRAAGRGLPRPRARERGEAGVQRRRAQPCRAGRPARRGGDGSRAVSLDRVRRRRRRPQPGLPRRADGQRLPRRVRHRGRARRRCRRRRHRPRHRRVPRGRAGRLVARLGPHGVRRAGRRRRRRARHRVRLPGDGRQLLGLRRRRAVAAAGLPRRGGGGRRLVGDHQARRHRGLGHRRHGDRAAALRGAGHPVPRARRDDRPHLHPARGRGCRPRRA